MRKMTAKFQGRCRDCREIIKPGQRIIWFGHKHTIHAKCHAPAIQTPIEPVNTKCHSESVDINWDVDAPMPTDPPEIVAEAADAAWVPGDDLLDMAGPIALTAVSMAQMGLMSGEEADDWKERAYMEKYGEAQ